MRKAHRIVATSMILLFVLTLTPAVALAQSLNGTLYAVQGAPVPVFFNFSVTGQTFVTTILTFGNGGNGRWFAAFGTTDGVSGTGQVIMPSGFALMPGLDTFATWKYAGSLGRPDLDLRPSHDGVIITRLIHTRVCGWLRGPLVGCGGWI